METRSFDDQIIRPLLRVPFVPPCSNLFLMSKKSHYSPTGCSTIDVLFLIKCLIFRNTKPNIRKETPKSITWASVENVSLIFFIHIEPVGNFPFFIICFVRLSTSYHYHFNSSLLLVEQHEMSVYIITKIRIFDDFSFCCYYSTVHMNSLTH